MHVTQRACYTVHATRPPLRSDWLSNGEADIEQLEVTSTPVARRSATPAGPSDAGSPAQRPASGWASGWGDSGGDGESVIDEGAPLVPQYGSPGMDQHQQQQEQQYGPFLPGLPLVAASPQHSAPLLGEGHVDAAQQQQQQQKHTLFDLAGMSLSDLMTAS